MTMILRNDPRCFHCDREDPHRQRKITKHQIGGVRCGRCNHELGEAQVLAVDRNAALLIGLLTERNAFEIDDFGVSDGLPFVKLRSRTDHTIVKFDWRPFKPSEYEVSSEDRSLQGKIDRLKVRLDDEQLKKLPALLYSAIDTIRRECVPIQGSFKEPVNSEPGSKRGQIRFRALTPFTGAMGQSLMGLLRVQVNWAFGCTIVEDNENQQPLVAEKSAV